MALIDLMEKMAKETNNFTAPEFAKHYNEAVDEFEQETGLKMTKLEAKPKTKTKANTIPENTKAYG